MFQIDTAKEAEIGKYVNIDSVIQTVSPAIINLEEANARLDYLRDRPKTEDNLNLLEATELSLVSNICRAVADSRESGDLDKEKIDGEINISYVTNTQLAGIFLRNLRINYGLLREVTQTLIAIPASTSRLFLYDTSLELFVTEVVKNDFQVRNRLDR